MNYGTARQTPRVAPLDPCSVRGDLDSPVSEKSEKHNCCDHSRSGNVSRKTVGGISAKTHPVFVLSKDGKPLMPTNWRKVRKLVKGGVAKRVWSKFGTPGIQMLIPVGSKTQDCVLGIDTGTKFEGYSVATKENNLNVKLDLPDKKKIVKKLDERRALRRSRRNRLRQRKSRFDNRNRDGFIAPSQLVMVQSRERVIKELFQMYPIKFVEVEDIKFNHAAKKWGSNFSTMEIGKKRINDLLESLGATVFKKEGWETSTLRKQFGYKKISDKSKDVFESHCCDSLTLCCAALGERIEPNSELIIVDDTYRSKRRRLHDTQFSKGGIREKYSTGTVFGLRKGSLVGFEGGLSGRITGTNKGQLRVLPNGKNRITKKLELVRFVSHQFITRKGGNSAPATRAGVPLPR